MLSKLSVLTGSVERFWHDCSRSLPGILEPQLPHLRLATLVNTALAACIDPVLHVLSLADGITCRARVALF